MKKIVFTLIFLFNFIYADSYFNISKIFQTDGVIWAIDFIDEDNIVFTKKDGTVFLFNQKREFLKEIYKIDVFYKGQGGLLDVAVSPNFKDDKTLYFTFVKNINNQGATTLAKGKLIDDKIVDFKELIVTKSISSTNAHFGSRITFDKKGHLFFSIGDRGVRKNAQDLTNHAGSILRLNLDGSIPKDNPFVKDKNILNEIYSYGHRNPQGIFFNKKNEKLYAIEHGPRGGDEINLIEKGLNYGWPIISYGKEYWSPLSVGEATYKEGMQQPLKYYVPSIAPSSLIVYSGDIFKELKGDLISGALKSRHLNRIVLKNDIIKEYRYLEDLNERIRDIYESPKGYLYISTDSGKIYKLSPKL